MFAADVTAVLENFKAASKRSGLEVAARLGERKAADVAELALGTLRSLLEQHRSKQGAAAKGPKGKHGDKAVRHQSTSYLHHTVTARLENHTHRKYGRHDQISPKKR